MNQSTLVERSAASCLEAEWRLFGDIESNGTGLRWLLWEPTEPAVIIGRHSRVDHHVCLDACRADCVPVLTRCSGGGTVVVGPGSLSYCVVAPLIDFPVLTDIPSSFAVLLAPLIEALETPSLAIRGGSDIAMGDRKVSGNAQRRGRRALLHHGTLLYDFDARLAERYLREPARQPAYRRHRSHTEFLGNLPLTRRALEARVAGALGMLESRLRLRR